jgi:hypothetical protein
MPEYFIFLSASIGLTLSLIGLCLWLDRQVLVDALRSKGRNVTRRGFRYPT